MASLGLFGESCSYKNRVQTAIWAVQLLLISAGIVSTVLLFKATVIPYSLNVVLSMPSLWTSSRTWLSPPYIYIILNFIIITIAASSTFHSQKQETHMEDDTDDSHTPPQQEALPDQTHFQDSSITTNHSPKIWQEIPEQSSPPSDIDIVKSTPSAENIIESSPEKFPDVNSGENDVSVFQPSSPQFTETSNSTITTTTENRRRTVADGDNDDEETLEATWKAITEGGGKAAGRQLNKSETWDTPPQVTVADAWRELRKSETFNDAVSANRRAGLRRDPSLSQDELNQRVEAFINKFNHEMRLQRQESDQRYLEMINRGR
ncbi:uncharacterized protein LOC132293660 [Cornus florida]|uniref:uncharacterized protein LOC132293660 n=1 Tax=Cornus florida TaxID=4283 RepID=UPI00289784BD|nr:uncharacterized protein LOC132293660 [Cornus florida]